MNLISFITMMSATLFAFRIMREQFADQQTTLTKIGTIIIFSFWVLALSLQNTVLNFCFAFCSFVFAVFEVRLEALMALSRADEWVLQLLNEFILNLRSGNSLRRSIELTAENQVHPLKKKWIQQTLNHVTFLQQESVQLPPHLLSLLAVLRRCETSPHLQTNLLENYRWLLLKRSEFRQKSDQAMLQMRVQAAVVVVLYFAISLLARSVFGWEKLKPCFLASMPFLLVGVILNIWIKRSFRWKT